MAIRVPIMAIRVPIMAIRVLQVEQGVELSIAATPGSQVSMKDASSNAMSRSKQARNDWLAMPSASLNSTMLFACALQCHSSNLRRHMPSWYVPQLIRSACSSRKNRPHSKPSRLNRYPSTLTCLPDSRIDASACGAGHETRPKEGAGADPLLDVRYSSIAADTQQVRLREAVPLRDSPATRIHTRSHSA